MHAPQLPVHCFELIMAEILGHITLIGKAVTTIEPRLTARVLRTLTGQRKKLTKNALRAVLEQAYPRGCELSRSQSRRSPETEVPS